MPLFIQKDKHGEWMCFCSNTADQDGFYPCDPSGRTVEPTEKNWTSNCYVCERCGSIIDHDSLQIVGQRNNAVIIAERMLKGDYPILSHLSS